MECSAVLVNHAQEAKSTVFIFLYQVQNSTIKLTAPQVYISRKRLYLSENLYSSPEDLCISCSLKTGTDKNQPTTYTRSLSIRPADHKTCRNLFLLRKSILKFKPQANIKIPQATIPFI